MDDHSRMTWLYLLQYKSNYNDTLQTFHNYVVNHFQTSVPQFSDSKCKKFMADHGIVHQTSCAHMPQQNARVERKHRHVLEVAGALNF